MNILFTISYDGTNYAGWQRQKNVMTVQEAIENALSEVFDTETYVMGASRTDAGVHAYAQKALASDVESLKIPLDKLPRVINAVLPRDIVITRAESVSDGFHPIFAVKNKTYEYLIYNAPYMRPTMRNYACHVTVPLDIGEMRRAARFFIGEHDFKAFSASGGSAKTSVRVIYRLDVASDKDLIRITITGNGFLYNMVRIICGTLVYVGGSRIAADRMLAIIASRDRTLAGKTLPPDGLYLKEIIYGDITNAGEGI